MLCVLVIPAWQPDELFPRKTAASQLNYWQPLGSLYVAACLQQAGHEVEFLNGAFLSHSQIIDHIRRQKPGLVALYATTFGWYKAIETAVVTKSVSKDSFVCVGGPYPIAAQSACLRDNTHIDAVITGEAEISVPALVEWLQTNPDIGHSLCPTLGVAYRYHDRIIQNPAQTYVENLDSLPFPARELLHDSSAYLPAPATYKRKPVAVVISSRGCNRRCIYCSQTDPKRQTGQRGIRFRSVENVLAEIELCLQQGYREIKFIDDSLAADYERLKRLCSEIIRRKLDFSWFASACVNQVDRPLLQAMKDAGCWAILFGAESGVQKNLNTLRKGITLSQTRQAVKMAQSVGLTVTTPFLFGIPGETYAEGLATIDFALELNPDFANFHALTAFPGTYLYNNIEKYGHASKNLTEYTYQSAAFVPHTMTRAQIQRLRRLAFRRFYLRPTFVLRKIVNLFRSHENRKNEIVALWKGFKSLLEISWDSKVFDLQRKK